MGNSSSVYDVVADGTLWLHEFPTHSKKRKINKVLEAMQRVNIEHLAERQIGGVSGKKNAVFWLVH